MRVDLLLFLSNRLGSYTDNRNADHRLTNSLIRDFNASMTSPPFSSFLSANKP